MSSSINNYSDPAAYWKTRLSKHFDLIGVGYSLLGPHYNARMYQARLKALDQALAATARTLTSARFLDVGCGVGFYTDYIRRHGIRGYVGLDITSESVSRLQEIYPQFHFYQADISQVKTGPIGEFDIIFAADVLFHIIDDDAFHMALHNLASWLTPNGLLILSDVFPAQTARTAVHVGNRSLDGYLNCLQSDGLRLLHIEPIIAILQPPPIAPGAARVWRFYSRSWNYALHFARWSLFYGLLADALGWLDDRLFLLRYGSNAPNSKWLLAEKRYVA